MLNEMSKLTGKDLVTVGIYSTLYFLINLVVGVLGFIPIFIPLLAVFAPLIGGIPFMLFLCKTKKFGMITLMGIIVGILAFISGMGYWAILTGLLFGILGDLIIKSGNYQNNGKSIIGYGIFSLWIIGFFMPFFVGRDAYFAIITQGYGVEYSTTLNTYMPMWIMPILIIVNLIFGILGGYVGKNICKKHFERAGIA